MEMDFISRRLMSNKHLLIILLSFGILGSYLVKKDKISKIENPTAPIQVQPFPEKPKENNSSPIQKPELPAPQTPELPKEEPKKNDSIDLKITIPGFLEYQKTKEQLKSWQKEAPQLAVMETYGKSSRNQDLFYLKISNKKKENHNPNIFLTAAIHGNESWSSACLMAYAGNLLNEYDKNERITKIIDSRNIYIIPIVSPDSYPKSRLVDKVDPNRNFFSNRDQAFQSVPPVENLKNLFQKVKPKSVISMHTYGRIFLIPYGETYKDCKNKQDYMGLVSKMAKSANYKLDKACNLYTRPIHGADVDYFHKNGAFSIVMEIGTHQMPPSLEQTISEFNRTWESILLFLEQSPEFEIANDEQIFVLSESTNISDIYFQRPTSPKNLRRIRIFRN